jgi:hydroxypyruvate reductase
MKVLNVGKVPQSLIQKLEIQYDVVDLNSDKEPLRHLQSRGGDYRAVITNAARGISNDFLTLLPNVTVISSYGVGLDKFDLTEIRRRNIALGYTPDVLNDCVADTAFGLVIDTMRGLSAADRFVRRGDWKNGQQWPMTHKVSGQRLGLVGFGRIGQIIAKRAAGFDMQVRYHTRNPVKGFEPNFSQSLIELASWCDCMTVICSGGADTKNLINEHVLNALGPQSFLVNVSRGSVVDEIAMVHALKTGAIAGAGLDVFLDEPNVPPEFFELENVVLLPHIASNTNQTRAAMADRVIENLNEFIRSGSLVSAA